MRGRLQGAPAAETTGAGDATEPAEESVSQAESEARSAGGWEEGTGTRSTGEMARGSPANSRFKARYGGTSILPARSATRSACSSHSLGKKRAVKLVLAAGEARSGLSRVGIHLRLDEIQSKYYGRDEPEAV